MKGKVDYSIKNVYLNLAACNRRWSLKIILLKDLSDQFYKWLSDFEQFIVDYDCMMQAIN